MTGKPAASTKAGICVHAYKCAHGGRWLHREMVAGGLGKHSHLAWEVMNGFHLLTSLIHKLTDLPRTDFFPPSFYSPGFTTYSARDSLVPHSERALSLHEHSGFSHRSVDKGAQSNPHLMEGRAEEGTVEGTKSEVHSGTHWDKSLVPLSTSLVSTTMPSMLMNSVAKVTSAESLASSFMASSRVSMLDD